MSAACRAYRREADARHRFYKMIDEHYLGKVFIERFQIPFEEVLGSLGWTSIHGHEKKLATDMPDSTLII